MIISIKQNNKWDSVEKPKMSVVTSVYNRRDVIMRAMMSIEKQTLRDIEYVIVNNGSKIDIDDVIEDYLNKATIPVLYIKKSYGGVHEGRNCGISHTRGEYIAILDSDDEYIPEALEIFYNTWQSIPSPIRNKCREVLAFCKNQNEERLGQPFPQDINNWSEDEQRKYFHNNKIEYVGVNRGDLLRENLFPEPEGVTYVPENIIWKKLQKLYKSYYINDCLRKYYIGSEDSLVKSFRSRKKPLQFCINGLWSSKYYIIHKSDYDFSLRESFLNIIKYCVYNHLIKLKKLELTYDWCGETLPFEARVVTKLLYIPSYFVALFYVDNYSD